MQFDRLGAFLDALIDYGIPGVDLALMRDHRMIYRHQAGFADREAGRPMAGNELYFLYSCSKVATVTAAMQLLEKGKFLLNDPLDAYFPEYKEMQIKGPDGELRKAQKPIRVKHLFCMTAGLNYQLSTPAIEAVKEKTAGRCPTAAVARAIAQNPLSFEPGTHWQYSLCHDVLAALVEIVSGMRFGEYMRVHLFEPLGMKSTGYTLTPGAERRLARQYLFDEAQRLAKPIANENPYALGPDYESGGAGVISCVEDYAKLTDALACGGVGQTGERILSRAAIDLMRTNHLDETVRRDFNWSQMAGYGYGLGVRTMVERAAGGALSPVGEFGWGGAAGAYILIDPEHRFSMFYAQHMRNSQEPYVHPRLRNIAYGCLEQ